jgi:enoyl-CoA hydratase/carnithine racemase
MSISTSKSNGVLVIAFDRPEKKNAITAAMYQQMADAIAEGEADSATRVMLIRGSTEAFTAGNDLEDFLQNPPKGEDSPVYQFMRQLSSANKPVLAAVAGVAVGIGTTMLMHCDVVYAAQNAKFSMPFTQLGLCPEFASSLLFPQMAGFHRASEKLLFGEAFNAEEALDMGLVNKVMPADALHEYALQRAAQLAAMPAAALRTTKRLLKAPLAEAKASVMAEEGRHFGAMLQSPEAREAFSAFLQKRKPDFSQFS